MRERERRREKGGDKGGEGGGLKKKEEDKGSTVLLYTVECRTAFPDLNGLLTVFLIHK